MNEPASQRTTATQQRKNPERANPDPSAASTTRPRKTRVLVIDDDPVITAIYHKQLRAAAFDVEVVHDGIAGFAALETFCPDVVLLDLVMPYNSGLEWLTGVRGMPVYKDLPVIIVSVESADSPLVKAAKKSPATGVLLKSDWNPEAVVQCVRWTADRGTPLGFFNLT